MNIYILCAMDRENKTETELMDNFNAAVTAANNDAFPPAYAAVEAAERAASENDAGANQWIDHFFVLSGEDRSEYDKAIKEKGQ
jgi:hypothetical protein